MAKAKEASVKVTEQAVAIVKPKTVMATGPSYLEGYKGKTGAEDIKSNEINIPRLKVGQDMSKEVQSGDVDRGDMFLNVSGETILTEGERLPFVILARFREIILWRPQKDGGGILARAIATKTDDGVKYAWDQPDTEFDVKVEGKVKVTWKTGKYADEDGLLEWGSEIPGDKESGKAATEHQNYIVVLPTRDNMVVALSCARTALGKAKDFNALLKMSSKPVVSRLFTVETVDDSRDAHDFKNIKFRPNRDAIEDVTDANAAFVNEAAFGLYNDMASSFAGKTIVVDQSDGGDQAPSDERA
jgi:hypothetical protein